MVEYLEVFDLVGLEYGDDVVVGVFFYVYEVVIEFDVIGW